MRHTLSSALVAALLTVLAACGSSAQPTATAAPSAWAETGQGAPSTTTAPVTGPAAPAAAADPFEQYYALVGPLEPTLSKQQLRDKLDQAVLMFCPGGRPEMIRLKTLASGPRNSAEDQRRANERAATSIGALWEYGCGRGHDVELYTPAVTPGTSTGQTTMADTGRRDANGETKEEYCARTHQQLDRCQAG
jgi:hypothetical protein